MFLAACRQAELHGSCSGAVQTIPLLLLLPFQRQCLCKENSCLLRLRLSPSSIAVSKSHQLLAPAEKKKKMWEFSQGSSSFCQFESSMREKRERWGWEGMLNSAPAVCSTGELWKFAVGKVSLLNLIFSSAVKKCKGSMSGLVIRMDPASAVWSSSFDKG